MRIFAALLLLSLSAVAHAGASEWVPLEINNGHLLMDVTINGKPSKAMIDTGANGNVISQDWLARNNGEFSRCRYLNMQGYKEDN